MECLKNHVITQIYSKSPEKHKRDSLLRSIRPNSRSLIGRPAIKRWSVHAERVYIVSPRVSFLASHRLFLQIAFEGIRSFQWRLKTQRAFFSRIHTPNRGSGYWSLPRNWRHCCLPRMPQCKLITPCHDARKASNLGLPSA